MSQRYDVTDGPVFRSGQEFDLQFGRFRRFELQLEVGRSQLWAGCPQK